MQKRNNTEISIKQKKLTGMVSFSLKVLNAITVP
jgi:hypothetical protein